MALWTKRKRQEHPARYDTGYWRSTGLNQLPDSVTWLTRRAISLSGLFPHDSLLIVDLIDWQRKNVWSSVDVFVQLKYENILLNATIFNVQTVAHEDTCDCLKARNLFETEPQSKQQRVVDAITDVGETESSMKNATKSEGKFSCA